MDIKLKIQELKTKPIEEQATQTSETDSLGCLCMLLGGIAAIIIGLAWSSFYVLLFILILSFVVGQILTRSRAQLFNEYNEIINEARKEMTRRSKAQKEAEESDREKHIIDTYGSNRKVIDYGGKFRTLQVIVSEEKELIRICEKDLSFSDILNFKITDDSKDIYTPAQYETQTNTGSMIGRAVVGGILTGGVGVVIGGATAKKSTVQTKGGVHRTTHDYRIQVYVNKLDESLLEIRLYSNAKATEEIAGVLTYILNKNEQTKKTVDENKSETVISVADELAKLAKLKEAGILSEDEFNSQKAKLLNSGK